MSRTIAGTRFCRSRLDPLIDIRTTAENALLARDQIGGLTRRVLTSRRGHGRNGRVTLPYQSDWMARNQRRRSKP
jgi:hypothetical protein